MEQKQIIGAVVGGIVAGFSIGVGFMLAQKTMGRFASKRGKDESDSVADAVKEGVKEGVKEAKTAQDAASFAAMNAEQGGGKRRPNPKRRVDNFLGFDGKSKNAYGDPKEMSFIGDPMMFGMSPNSGLNSF